MQAPGIPAFTRIFCLLLALGLNSCRQAAESADPIPFTPYEVTGATPALTLPSGVVVRVVLMGPGPRLADGNRVCIHSYGQLPDGKKFDSTWERGMPICFVPGRGELLPSLEEALKLLRMGSKVVVEIPAGKGYPENETPPNIPPGSALVFHIELMGNF